MKISLTIQAPKTKATQIQLLYPLKRDSPLNRYLRWEEILWSRNRKTIWIRKPPTLFLDFSNDSI